MKTSMQLENSEKVQQLVKTGRDLFWMHGIRRVTIEEICSKAKVSKMTFYKHFKNKIEMIIHIYDQIVAESMKRYHEIMDQEIDYEEKVRRIIDLKMDQTEDLSKEFFSDIYSDDFPEIRAYIDEKSRESMQIIVNDFVKAQKKGELRQDLKPEFILYFLNQVLLMARDKQLMTLYDNPRELIMELTNLFFYGIIQRN